VNVDHPKLDRKETPPLGDVAAGKVVTVGYLLAPADKRSVTLWVN
jgi:hypothetical protein